jgi:hypothetical protein
MFCCPYCFSDSFLRSQIYASQDKTGNCTFCRNKDVIVIKPDQLYDWFQPLLALYQIDPSGKPLNHLLQNDWSIFGFDTDSTQKKLLKEISSDDNIIKANFTPVLLTEKKNLQQWEKFREELKHKNRFFPNNAPGRDEIEPFGKHIGIELKKDSQKFYRARINNSNKAFPLSQMKKPPKNVSTNGRANPIGIPYLYVASTIETAISEVRGHKGETLTIAEFQLNKALELVDLRDPKNTVSPFELVDEDELEFLYKNMPFLSMLGNELSKPIIPREANLEYLPSQYLCELFKTIGFHGIIYKSSISDGHNYVLFSDRGLKPVGLYQYKITDIETKSKKL